MKTLIVNTPSEASTDTYPMLFLLLLSLLYFLCCCCIDCLKISAIQKWNWRLAENGQKKNGRSADCKYAIMELNGTYPLLLLLLLFSFLCFCCRDCLNKNNFHRNSTKKRTAATTTSEYKCVLVCEFIGRLGRPLSDIIRLSYMIPCAPVHSCVFLCDPVRSCASGLEM